MSSMTRLETFCNLGYRKDPFVGALYKTGDSLRVARILNMAVESRAMVNIIGVRGIGKSEAVRAALKEMRVRVVNTEKIDKENLTIADIRTSLILDLSDESVKRGGEVSSRQLRRIAGDAAINKKQKIVLMIEEAQRLHPNTLRSLKSLREMEWQGERDLFTIILVAQANPMARPGVSEVTLRSDCVYLQGLTADEAAGYVRATIGKHFDESAIDALAELPQSRNYLELQALTVELLNVALADGRDIVSPADVQTIATRQAVALPKGTPRSKQTAPVSGQAGLATVLARRSQSALDDPNLKGVHNA